LVYERQCDSSVQLIRNELLSRFLKFARTTALTSDEDCDAEDLWPTVICSVSKEDRLVAEILEPQFEELRRSEEAESRRGADSENEL
jgi:hypothetical protein